MKNAFEYRIIFRDGSASAWYSDITKINAMLCGGLLEDAKIEKRLVE